MDNNIAGRIEQGVRFENRQNALNVLFYNYEEYCKVPIDLNQRNSDIWQLLPLLTKFTKGYEHITEVGTRHAVSTTAFMVNCPKKIVCYDFAKTDGALNLERLSKNLEIEFVFHQQNILDAEIEETDCLFIDSFHQKHQLEQELSKHSHKAKHLILLHDTTTYGWVGENIYPPVDSRGMDGQGLRPAINEFLQREKDWKIIFDVNYNNGLTILQRQ